MAGDKWISGAVRPSKVGSFTAKAKVQGLSVAQLANKVLKKGSKASLETKRQANFAKNMRSIAKNK